LDPAFHAPAETFEQAKAVVAGYASRWKIEEFHRTWKRGLCRVEDNQLQSRNAILKWATILAAVAARALRLAKLIRSTPDIPASEEFTEYEIDAAFILLKKNAIVAFASLLPMSSVSLPTSVALRTSTTEHIPCQVPQS
jgi:hypothetical protein